MQVPFNFDLATRPSDHPSLPLLTPSIDLADARSTALKDGIARIVRTFGDTLTAFRFPPRTAGRVQVFMDYYLGGPGS